MHQQQSIKNFNAPMNMYEAKVQPMSGPMQHTTSPIVTGSTVLAVKYADGVMMMADTMGSYGNMAMFKQISRLRPVNQYTLLGGGGEYSDFQYILKMIEDLRVADFAANDGCVLTPAEIHSYLGRVMYNRRSKIDPLWNQLVTAGYYQGKPSVDTSDKH